MVGCKRRTLLSLFCFEWMNAMLNGFASFPCNDVSVLPAPSGKVLWNINDRSKWEVAYDKWLGRWAGLGIYTVGDLTGMPPGLTLDLRSEMWLEEADEFGMMLMTLGKRFLTWTSSELISGLLLTLLRQCDTPLGCCVK